MEIRELRQAGQSVWLDDLSRRMLRDGAFTQWIGEGITGVTSNPKILTDALKEDPDAYAGQVYELTAAPVSPGLMAEALAIRDVQDAADLLWPAHRQTEGSDGFVSLEVSPHLARDTEATVHDALRLWRAVARPNVFIKIPATPAGITAIEECVARGIHVNVTLLFSLERYRQVSEAFLRGLERRLDNDEPIDRPWSVASFFLSRIDSKVDQYVTDERLRGRIAVASAKVAYQTYRDTFSSDRWRHLEARGARPQKLLWASTSAKREGDDELRYVEPLIGPETVTTMPLSTLDAFRRRGEVRATVTEGVNEARGLLEELERSTDTARLFDELEEEGIEKFATPYDELLATLGREVPERL